MKDTGWEKIKPGMQFLYLKCGSDQGLFNAFSFIDKSDGLQILHKKCVKNSSFVQHEVQLHPEN